MYLNQPQVKQKITLFLLDNEIRQLSNVDLMIELTHQDPIVHELFSLRGWDQHM